MSFYVAFDPQMKTATKQGGGLVFDEWLAKARSYGYAYTYFTAPYALWVAELPWQTLVVVGFSNACGFKHAAKWARETFQGVLLLQRAAGPKNTIWAMPGSRSGRQGVLDPQDVPRFDENDVDDVATHTDLIIFRAG